MKLPIAPTITTEKPTKERVLELVRVALYTLCFFVVMLHLTGLGTAFWPAADQLITTYSVYICAAASFAAILYLVISKKVRKIKDMNIGLFLFYAVMTTLVVFYRGAKDGSILYALLIPLALLPADEREVKMVRRGLYNAGVMLLAAFLFMYFRSHFRIIDNMEEFLIVETTLAFLALIHSKDVYGRFRVPYILSFLWLGGTIYFAVLYGGGMYLMSMIVLLLMLFVFGFRKTAFPALAVRILVLICVLLAAGWIALICYSKMLSVGTDAQAAAALFEKTPIHNNEAAVEYLSDRIVTYNSLSDADPSFVSSPLLTLLNSYSGGKMGMWRTFLENTAFAAGEGGVMVRGLLCESSENHYIQSLYHYGFLAGGLKILFFFVAWITAIAGYIKTKKELYFAPFVVLTATFGVWMNTSAESGSVMTFLAVIALIPLLGFKAEEPKEEA